MAGVHKGATESLQLGELMGFVQIGPSLLSTARQSEEFFSYMNRSVDALTAKDPVDIIQGASSATGKEDARVQGFVQAYQLMQTLFESFKAADKATKPAPASTSHTTARKKKRRYYYNTPSA